MYGAFAAAMFALFVATEAPGSCCRFHRGPNVLSDTKLARAGLWLSEMAPRFLAVVVPLFLIANVFVPGHVPMDVGYAAISLFVVVLGGFWFMPQYRSHFVRGGLYVGSAFLMYMGEQSGIPEIWPIYVTQNSLLALIAILVLLSMRFSRGNRFQTTPLDYLMVFFRVDRTAPAGNARRHADVEHSGSQAHCVVFFVRTVAPYVYVDRVRQLGLVSLWILLGLGVRAWL
jgi:UDP-GlcNAc:undecaprenyl-phosphate GlcNAc-1-phosphate transferase